MIIEKNNEIRVGRILIKNNFNYVLTYTKRTNPKVTTKSGGNIKRRAKILSSLTNRQPKIFTMHLMRPCVINDSPILYVFYCKLHSMRYMRLAFCFD